jgi:hypothetical protein
MYNIKNHKDLNKLRQEITLPDAIVGMIYLDIKLIEENYPDSADRPHVSVLNAIEWRDLIDPFNGYDKDDYEFKDIIYLDHTMYVEKYLYQDISIDEGIYYYVLHAFGAVIDYFNGSKYITANAQERLPLEVQIRLWQELDRSSYETGLDYLQVFDIKQIGPTIHVTHRQEVPAYSRVFRMNAVVGDATVYIISSLDENRKEYSTMLMAEDY